VRTIERSSAFKRDYKREAKGQHRHTLDESLSRVLLALAEDQQLEPRYQDHDLSGNWSGYRECHVKPDLLLIYRKSADELLRLARLGSHSDLFGSRHHCVGCC
jgi:mRNA interferase YafQ